MKLSLRSIHKIVLLKFFYGSATNTQEILEAVFRIATSPMCQSNNLKCNATSRIAVVVLSADTVCLPVSSYSNAQH